MFRSVLLQIFVLALLCSCGKEGYDFGNEENTQIPSADQGAVEFSIATDYTLRTKAGESNLNLNPDDFSFAILNASNYLVEQWQKFSQVKGQSIKLNQGSYSAKAWYGDSTATGFDAVYFVGKSNFVVERLKTTKDVTVTCRQGNAKVAVKWGDTIKNQSVNFYASVRREGYADSLFFTKDETRAGYIPAGNIKLKVSTTDSKGVEKIYEHEAAVPVLAQDFLTLHIDSRKGGGGGTPGTPSDPDEGYIVITYNIDTTATDKPQQITIPAFLVSKPAPTLQGVGFDQDNKIEFWEGDISDPVKVMINAPAFVKSCKVNLVSPFVNITLPDTVDLVSDATNSAKLKDALGIEWDDQLQNKRFATIDLTAFAKSIVVTDPNTPSQTTKFTVAVQDMRGKKSGNVVYTLVAKRPVLSLSEVPDYDMWANKVYVELVTDVEDNSLFTFEYLVNNLPTEVKATLVSTSGNRSRYEITGLTPGTSYILRANYCNGRYYTNTVAVSTEAAQQLVNGDMESWSSDDWNTYGLNKIYHYYPGLSSSNKSWGTRNTLTMDGVSGGTSSGTSNQVVAYRWNSCTIPTGDAVSGNAAEIRTMALSTKSVAGTEVGSGFLWATKDINNFMMNNGKVYAGYLYTGTADVTTSYPTPAATGISHSSRPVSVKFSYKYAPYNGDKCKVYAKLFDAQGNVIAQTQEFVSGDSKSEYTVMELSFAYSNLQKKAASIMVFFQSGTNETMSYVQHIDGSYDGNPWSLDTYVGSVLKVDNVVLNY